MKGANANLVLGAVIAVVGFYALTRTENAIAKVVDGTREGARKFREGLFWDADELGAGAELTDSARLGEEEMIAMGYLERTDDGGTRITAAGEEYIERQRLAQAVAEGG